MRKRQGTQHRGEVNDKEEASPVCEGGHWSCCRLCAPPRPARRAPPQGFPSVVPAASRRGRRAVAGTGPTGPQNTRVGATAAAPGPRVRVVAPHEREHAPRAAGRLTQRVLGLAWRVPLLKCEVGVRRAAAARYGRRLASRQRRRQLQQAGPHTRPVRLAGHSHVVVSVVAKARIQCVPGRGPAAVEPPDSVSATVPRVMVPVQQRQLWGQAVVEADDEVKIRVELMRDEEWERHRPALPPCTLLLDHDRALSGGARVFAIHGVGVPAGTPSYTCQLTSRTCDPGGAPAGNVDAPN
eukprot:362504-Chlamydomonas_euryale.AAC.9